MSIARHHAEWLSLIEASGPFISLKVLLEIFPQGLDAHDPDNMRNLKLAFEEWQISQESFTPNIAIHNAWVNFVLRETLGFSDEVLLTGQKIPEGIKASFPEHNETVRPDRMLVNPTDTADAGKPRLLIQILPGSQDLDKRLANSRWSASPATRMMELLHATNVRLGLITNGHRWMLVNAPRGETTGFISWYTNLWLEENITLRAFRGLLGVQRFFGVGENKTLEKLLELSAEDQEEVTNTLGKQVRKAVEVLVQKFDRIDKDGSFAAVFNTNEIGEKRLYEATLTVMMRLVFLFSAEEQGLLLLGDALYDNYYAVSTLRAQLRESADEHGEEVLERRSDAWARLLATFRAVHSGVRHDSFQLPAYGGHLFDPDKYPFLEGRKEQTSWKETSARPLAIDNRTVLHLLEALQILQVKLPGGGSEPRRLSFRALDVEQIGHVYEGLLDHTAVRATAPVLGLEGTKDKEPEVLLEKLEQMKAKGEESLLEFLNEETGRSVSALKKALVAEIPPQDTQRFLVACDHDRTLWERVKPFAGIVRKDTLGYPVVINTGSVYVTQGEDRRSTGTHYTPRSLTEPIVQYTLEPLVYKGPAEGKPREEWKLKSAGELLKLKICDFAMGSGAFLVQACRYMAERLVEAWEEAERAHPGQIVVTPEGDLSKARTDECLVPKDPVERIIVAKRIVADRCLYGVDRNPMAVEMAKLSLWLVTMQKSKPFTFLDHALRCGDSLLGVIDAKQIEYFSLQPEKKIQSDAIEAICKPLIEEAIAKRKELENFIANDIHDIERKEQLFSKAEEALDKVRFLGDLLIGEALKRIGKSDDMAAYELSVLSEEVNHALSDKVDPYHNMRVQALRDKAKRMLGKHTPFHWLLEFPEVFWGKERNGFDAIMSNPPFLGRSKVSGNLGDDYLGYILCLLPSSNGNADLCSHFLRRSSLILNNYGYIGMITTNSICQGETKDSGLGFLVKYSHKIIRAIKSTKWPGSANVFISLLHICKGLWTGESYLDGEKVSLISPYLDSEVLEFTPYRLAQNCNLVYRGTTVGGEGFILTDIERKELIKQDPKSKEIIKPFLTGQDINQDPKQQTNRYTIDFGSYSEGIAKQYEACWSRLYNTVRLQRKGNKIKQREVLWWQYIGRQEELYEAVKGHTLILACSQVSKYWSVSWVQANQIFADKVVVFDLTSQAHFAVLNSCFHIEWAEKTSSRLKEDPNYLLAKTFETFPFPNELLGIEIRDKLSHTKTLIKTLENLGVRYHEGRCQIMLSRQEGLTTTYNRFHNPSETSSDIAKLRQLHIEMDQAVAAAYGWTDLDLGHGFHETKQGIRYTICEPARREVLDRLLQLNHERYAEECKAGLHDTGKAKKKGTASKSKKAKAEISKVQESLF
ncbi:MAG: type IIL restriction-modification enzyme MmeI [Acidobacteriota bacterium]